jgi:hypothetical protein
MKCPKYHFDKSDDTFHCSKYAALLKPSEEIFSTKTLEPIWKEDPIALQVIQEARFDIEMFRKHKLFYGYCFFVRRK